MTEELAQQLGQLKLPSFAKHHLRIAEQCEKESKNHIQFLSQLTHCEIESRYHKRIERLLRQAKLPREKNLESFEYKRIPGLSSSQIKSLSEGRFIDLSENVLIFGNPGTGKTHLAIALAQEWCLQGRKIYYTTAASLTQNLLKTKHDLKLNAFIKKLDKFEVLIIDDISYIPYDRQETDVLFTLLSERYEMRSILITSNLPFANWDSIFKDKMTTTAAIDRLVHHSIILELNAESYRINSAKNRQNEKDKNGGKEM